MEKADLYWLARLFLKIELFDKTRTLKPLKLDLSVFKFIDILIKTIKKKGTFTYNKKRSKWSRHFAKFRISVNK